jgi:hypothetical protein
LRRVGHDTFVELTRAEAAHWLANPVWAGLNPDLAKQLAGADVQPIDHVTVMVPEGVSIVTDATGREYRVEIKNGRAVVRLPTDSARQLLNGGLPCCEPWQRENAFLAARLGSPPKLEPGIHIASHLQALEASRPLHPRDVRGTMKELGVVR